MVVKDGCSWDSHAQVRHNMHKKNAKCVGEMQEQSMVPLRVHVNQEQLK